ncbi:hypothetical protein SUGI_1511890 [Cryptomeria japonica]|uniref:Endonuclease/exonuclease/phosphatase domain-containing protein n=1 Tax=Cryptomeria japonica TaxID=3369 RepID=A0AAD3RQ95_CRYJA|nr:hypothetical protein SUGI_1511890 [Cryptomeria japonica]
MNEENFNKATNSFWDASFFINCDSNGASGGIATLWNPNFFEGSLIHFEKNCLFIRMKDLRSPLQWYLVNVYAPNARFPRAQLWSTLFCLIGNQNNDSWMVGGDFNSPLYPSEKASGCEDYLDNMIDLVYFISPSNWCYGNHLFQVQLDRVLVFTNWENFDSFSLFSFPRPRFDHNDILLVMDGPCDHKYYPFRNEIMWSHFLDFINIFEQKKAIISNLGNI